MRALGHGLAFLLVVAVVATVPGCSGSGGEGSTGPSLTLTSVVWCAESLDPSFWSPARTDGRTAFYDFWIHYSGDIAYGDIQSARVYEPDGSYWTLDRDSSFFDATHRTIGGWGRWYRTSTTNLLPIGTFRAEVTLTNGQVASLSKLIPAPASTATDGFASMYSEDLLTPPADAAPMIRRPAPGSQNTFATATQTITVTFAVNDPRAYGGWVWLYDANDTWIGTSVHFRDATTGGIVSQLGGVLRTDGSENVMTLGPSDVQLATGSTFAQISMIRVVVTDGQQYGGPVNGVVRFDGRSVGPVTSLTVL